MAGFAIFLPPTLNEQAHYGRSQKTAGRNTATYLSDFGRRRCYFFAPIPQRLGETVGNARMDSRPNKTDIASIIL